MLLLDEIFNRNLAVTPQYLSVMLGALKEKGKIDFSLLEMDGQAMDSMQLANMAAGFSRDAPRPYRVQNGVAIIPVHGSLTHRFGYLQPVSGMTGYDGIRANIQMAQDDTTVKGIVYDINSPGGSVDGLFDLTDWAKAFVTKPTRAIVDPEACSAAQMFASVAGTVTLSRTDRMGSIGAIMAHVDISKMLEDGGEKITLITAGSRKAEGNSYEPLPDDVFDRKKGELEEIRTMFVQTLVDNRGCDFNALMATEAAVLNAKQAVELKLADKIMSPADSLEEFIDQINPTNTGVIPMPKQETNANAPTDAPQLNESAIRAEATTAERERIKGIVLSEQSEGRTKMAYHIAFSTDMSAEQGVAMLGVSEKMSATLESTSEPETATTDFATTMSKFDPNVPSDDNDLDASADADTSKKSKNPLIAAHSQMHA